MELIHNPLNCKLGRKPPLRRPTLFKLERYVDVKRLPPPPASRKWSDAVTNWGMLLNDQEGDCTIAGRAHQHMLRTALVGAFDPVSDEDVQKEYVAVTGIEGNAFDPATGTNDNGCALEDVLEYERKAGRIGAYASFDPKNLTLLRFVIDAFESAYVGVSLPLSAQNQDTWTVADPTLVGSSAPGSWGGHCVILPDYTPEGFTCVTWGDLKDMDVPWWNAYGEEAYAVLSNEMVNGSKPPPSGFSMDTLLLDLKAVGSQGQSDSVEAQES